MTAALIFAASILVGTAGRLAWWYLRGGVYVARVYQPDGATFVIGPQMATAALALAAAWDRAEHLGRMLRPPVFSAEALQALGYRAETVRL